MDPAGGVDFAADTGLRLRYTSRDWQSPLRAMARHARVGAFLRCLRGVAALFASVVHEAAILLRT